ncbi:hypothetical protein Aperf_G00000055532 [Anoplocephala perfoliata]
MKDADQHVEDLPIESIKRICARMDVAEMVRVCLTLPGWDYVLSLPYNKKMLEDYVQRFQWLDKRLCELVAEELSTSSFSDVPQAILHHFTEETIACNRPARLLFGAGAGNDLLVRKSGGEMWLVKFLIFISKILLSWAFLMKKGFIGKRQALADRIAM